MRVLLLGGTTEASRLAHALKSAGIETVFSYAGRTSAPLAQPVPVRIGGFGGVAGLRAYFENEAITHVVDATHPFAARMSNNAYTACAHSGVALIRFERPAWQQQTGDNWHCVATIKAACDALPDAPARVFLAIGKMHIGQFAAKPQHHYLLRLVDAPEGPLPLPDVSHLVARGPFDMAGDVALLQAHRITHVVAKNAGGSGAVAKVEAARALGLEMIMIARPDLPETTVAPDTETVLRWLHHPADRGV